MSMLVYRVGNIETGDIYTVRIDIHDFSINMFKHCLFTFSGIPSNEQILLIGPPFKRLDSQFSTTMQDDDQKIYLYNRKLFTDSTILPTEIKLKPYELPDPPTALTEIPNSIRLENLQSPILRSLPSFERQYLLHIRRGESFVLCSEQISASCKRCIEQMEIQQLSLLAAIGNLQDHYKSTQASYETARQRLQEQQTRHKSLLDNFELSLERLKKIPVHSSLYPPVTTEEELVAQKERGLTLLETLPVEQEYAWVHKCARAHEKVEESMNQLQIVYDKVTLSFQTLNYSQIEVDLVRSRELAKTIDEEITSQKCLLSDLRDSYHSISEKLAIIVDKASSDGPTEILESECTELMKELASGARKQENEQLLLMENITRKLMRTKDDIAHFKNLLTREIFGVMKQVAHIQTDIQFKLRKGMELMRKWRQGDNGYFQHLERLQQLPESYRQFLIEVMRRKKYTEDFEKLINATVTQIHDFRDRETKRREKFMETLGNSLPPLFFESVPSLIEKPPYFNATVTERQYLPDITSDDIAALTSLGVISTDDEIPYSMNSSLSSITLNDGGEILAGLVSRERTDSMVSMGEREVTFPTLENQYEVTPMQRLEELENENIKLREQIKYLTQEQLKPKSPILEQPQPLSQEAEPFEFIFNHFIGEVNTILSSLKTLSGKHFVPQETKEDDGDKKISANENSQQLSYADEVAQVFDQLSQAISRTQTAFESKLKEKQMTSLASQSSPLQTNPELQPSSLPATTQNLDFPLPSPSFPEIQQLHPSETIPKISFLTFEVGDIALFLSTNKPDVYLAFSHGKCPHRYLSQDSLTQFKTPKQQPNGYILGKIIFIESKIATKDDKYPGIGPINNPLRLADGVEYHLVDIERVSFGSKHSRRRSGSMKGRENENEKEMDSSTIDHI